MYTIDLDKIIKQKKLDKREIAISLFPGNKYPILAINRVLYGDTKLDSDQVKKLATILNTSIDNLYDFNFTGGRSKDDKIVIKTGDFTAELDRSFGSTRLSHKGVLLSEILVHDPSIGLSDYLEQIKQVINKYITNKSKLYEQSN